MTKASEGAILAAIEILNGRIDGLDKKIDDMRDKLAGVRGDTVGTDECAKCQSQWLDKRFFAVGLTVATAVLGLLTAVRGLW